MIKYDINYIINFMIKIILKCILLYNIILIKKKNCLYYFYIFEIVDFLGFIKLVDNVWNKSVLKFEY